MSSKAFGGEGHPRSLHTYTQRHTLLCAYKGLVSLETKLKFYWQYFSLLASIREELRDYLSPAK